MGRTVLKTSSTFNDKKRKEARLKGQVYSYKSVDAYGVKTVKMREPRDIGARCNSYKCINSQEKKCCEFPEEDRQVINQLFWGLETWEAKKMYVCNHVILDVGFGNVRKNHKYYLSDKKNEKKLVCRTFFLSTLSIGEKTLQEWIKEFHYGSLKKVKDVNPNLPAKTKEKDTFLLQSYLESIDKLPSHYCRSQSTKMYVSTKFKTLRELYNNYSDYCLSKYTSPCSRTKFEIFFYKSNLSLFVPKKDLCNRCVSYNNKVLSEKEYNAHITKKEDAKSEKDGDKKRALRSELTMITNDAQSTKPCPSTEANVMYYHLKLNVHNNTIYNVANKQCKNYIYTEMDAPSTASTFISCLYDFISKYCVDSNKPKLIIVWCDNCSHQNKNIMLSNALLELCVRYNITIMLKYLEVGHTFLECDSVHSLLERTMKGVNIYHPSDYVKLAKQARQNPSPYMAEHLNFDFFLDFTIKSGQFYSSLRPPKEKNSQTQLKVNDIVALKHDAVGQIHYKTSHKQDWILLKQKQKNTPQRVKYPKLNTAPLKLEQAKYDHLQIIKKTLPAYIHKYYETLPHKSKKQKKN